MSRSHQDSLLRQLFQANGDVDSVFDAVYPDWVRHLSKSHWTPFHVAVRAARLLVTSARTRILDVGSGAGKFCIIGALVTEGTFVGVEQRRGLVDVATQAARRYGVEERISFMHANMTTIDWNEYDAFYLYNPFHEHTRRAQSTIDSSIELAEHFRDRYVAFTRQQLKLAPAGTRVATYHGFGGRMPASYKCVRREGCGTDFVELWVKQPTELWHLPPDRTDAALTGAGNACA